jgi:hypothetical protein
MPYDLMAQIQGLLDPATEVVQIVFDLFPCFSERLSDLFGAPLTLGLRL